MLISLQILKLFAKNANYAVLIIVKYTNIFDIQTWHRCLLSDVVEIIHRFLCRYQLDMFF